MRFRLRTLRAGWGPVGGDVEVRPGDRELLNPLFEVLRDRRALLHAGHGRAGQAPYVTESIKAIREQLTQTLQNLDPDSEARVWVEKLRAACREYLTAVEARAHDASEFEPAIAQLRAAFYEVANHAAAYYRIPAARELANEMAGNRNVAGASASELPGSELGPLGTVLHPDAADPEPVTTLEPSLLKGRVYPYHYLPAVDTTEKALCLRCVAAVAIPTRPEPAIDTENEELFEQLLADSRLERWIVAATSRRPRLPPNAFWRWVHPTRSTIVTHQRPPIVTVFGGWTVEGRAAINLRPNLTIEPAGTAWVNVDIVVRPDAEPATASLALSLEDLFLLVCTEFDTVIEHLVPAMSRQLDSTSTDELRAIEMVLSVTGASMAEFVPLMRSAWRRAEGAFDPQGADWSLEEVSALEDKDVRTETARSWFKRLLRDAGIRGHERAIDAFPPPG